MWFSSLRLSALNFSGAAERDVVAFGFHQNRQWVTAALTVSKPFELSRADDKSQEKIIAFPCETLCWEPWPTFEISCHLIVACICELLMHAFGVREICPSSRQLWICTQVCWCPWWLDRVCPMPSHLKTERTWRESQQLQVLHLCSHRCIHLTCTYVYIYYYIILYYITLYYIILCYIICINI